MISSGAMNYAKSNNLLLDIMEDSRTIKGCASCSHMTASMCASCRELRAGVGATGCVGWCDMMGVTV